VSILKVGDVVRLKSGGPTMTVIAIEGKPQTINATYYCGVDQGYREIIGLPVEALVKVDS